MSDETLEQQVVIYDHPDEMGRVFDTCYTESQMQATRLRCANKHGGSCNARIITAKRRMSGQTR